MQMPAGLIDEGEDAAQAAARELKEETGMPTMASTHAQSVMSAMAHTQQQNVRCTEYSQQPSTG